MINKCKICNCLISSKGGRRTCNNIECKRKYANLYYYEKKLYSKKCRNCGKDILVKYRVILCENCKKNIKHEYQTFNQNLTCITCGKILKTIQKNKTRKIIIDLPYKVCDTCKNLSYKRMSERMKTDNNMFYKIIGGKKIKIQDKKKKYKNKFSSKEEMILSFSTRMKINNPMYNDWIKEKVKNTTKERIKNGQRIYKTGKEHHLFKGNRKISKFLKIRLSKWSRLIMEECNFTCQKCGKRGSELHTHHLEPFREIIKKYKIKYNINYLDDLQEGTPLFEDISNDIIKYHYDNKQIGYVVCPDCHAEIDKYYRKRKIKLKELKK